MRASGKRKQAYAPRPHNPYQAVAVYSASGQPCPAAKALEGRLFLAKAAPSLPLGGCSHPAQCSCRYRRYEDRRREVRRDVDAGLPAKIPPFTDRRSHRERRAG